MLTRSLFTLSILEAYHSFRTFKRNVHTNSSSFVNAYPCVMTALANADNFIHPGAVYVAVHKMSASQENLKKYRYKFL